MSPCRYAFADGIYLNIRKPGVHISGEGQPFRKKALKYALYILFEGTAVFKYSPLGLGNFACIHAPGDRSVCGDCDIVKHAPGWLICADPQYFPRESTAGRLRFFGFFRGKGTAKSAQAGKLPAFQNGGPESRNNLLVLIHPFGQRNAYADDAHGWFIPNVICHGRPSCDLDGKMHGRIRMQRRTFLPGSGRCDMMDASKGPVEGSGGGISVLQGDIDYLGVCALKLKRGLGHFPAPDVFRQGNAGHIREKPLKIEGRTAGDPGGLLV